MKTGIRSAGRILLDTLSGLQRNQVSLMAAGLAYYLLISASPLLVVAIAVIGAILGRQQAQQVVSQRMETALGPEAAASVTDLMRDVDLLSGGLSASLIAVAILFFGSTRAFAALSGSLDVIWRSPPAASFRGGILMMVRSGLLAFLMVLLFGMLILTTLAFETLTGISAASLGAWSGFTPQILSIGKRLALFLLRVACLAAVYRILPARRIAWRDVWPSAVVAVLLLSFGRKLVELYLTYSGTQSVYGAAGSLLVLLLSFYYAALVVLLGAQFARAYADHRRRRAGLQTPRETRTGS